MHWSGERFSFSGKHFDARDIIARPSPRAGNDPHLDRRKREDHQASGGDARSRAGCR